MPIRPLRGCSPLAGLVASRDGVTGKGSSSPPCPHASRALPGSCCAIGRVPPARGGCGETPCASFHVASCGLAALPLGLLSVNRISTDFFLPLSRFPFPSVPPHCTRRSPSAASPSCSGTSWDEAAAEQSGPGAFFGRQRLRKSFKSSGVSSLHKS